MELVSTIFTFVLYFFGACFLIMFLPMVIPESLSLRYHLMNVAYMVYATFVIGFYLFLLLFIPIEDSMRISTGLGIWWITLMGVDVQTLRNADVIQKTGNAVIVLNHQSFFDPFPVLQLWNMIFSSTLLYLGSEMSSHMFLRKALETQSHTYIDRRCSRTASRTLMTTAETYFKSDKQNKIAIFPEGERNRKMKDYKFLEFKRGAFRVAKAYNVPVIPLVISPLYFIDHHRHYFTKGKAIASVLDPVYPDELTVDELSDKVKSLMQEEFLRLKEELVDGKTLPVNSERSNSECSSVKKDS